ncbi:MAG: tetratricopeptide repeat protein [Rhodopirellula sp.]|nr:tetratricopeptide repeat protein [Rhodopirellula sp.]
MKLQTYPIACAFIVLAGCDRNTNTAPAESGTPRVVFRADDGRELTFADLADATGTFEYKIVGAGQIPPEANSLHQKGRQLGASGDYDGAIRALAEAQLFAPDWPYPTYDMAFTYLLMKDFAKAREYYRKTVEMSPRGFFTAITALDALDREACGDLPEGTYAAYIALEWVSDPEQKATVVSQMTDKFPTFAPVWEEYATLCHDPKERLAAIGKGLAAKPDRETKGMLLINKALTLNEQGDTGSAKAIHGNLALDPETAFGNEHLAKQTLGFITK